MKRTVIAVTLIFAALIFFCPPATAQKKPDQEKPREFGLYVKTGKGLARIMPNVIFDQDGVLYIESNEPQRLSLTRVEYFLIYGQRDITYLTLNPMVLSQQSPLGKMRFVFGKEIPIEVQKKGDNLYSVKAKGLFGRGYYSFWIEDMVWDFIVE